MDDDNDRGGDCACCNCGSGHAPTNRNEKEYAHRDKHRKKDVRQGQSTPRPLMRTKGRGNGGPNESKQSEAKQNKAKQSKGRSNECQKPTESLSLSVSLCVSLSVPRASCCTDQTNQVRVCALLGILLCQYYGYSHRHRHRFLPSFLSFLIPYSPQHQ